jgi:hypothetical protein
MKPFTAATLVILALQPREHASGVASTWRGVYAPARPALWSGRPLSTRAFGEP